MLCLLIIEGDGERRAVVLDGPISIGRSRVNDLHMAVTGISRRHARIEFNRRKATVHDLESTNGTWVNGLRLNKPRRLQSGDEIRLGNARLFFRQVKKLSVACDVRTDDQLESGWVRFTCSKCSASLAARQWTLRTIRPCPRCRTPLVIPGKRSAAHAAPPQPWQQPDEPCHWPAVQCSHIAPHDAPESIPCSDTGAPVPADVPLCAKAHEPQIAEAVITAPPPAAAPAGGQNRKLDAPRTAIQQQPLRSRFLVGRHRKSRPAALTQQCDQYPWNVPASRVCSTPAQIALTNSNSTPLAAELTQPPCTIMSQPALVRPRERVHTLHCTAVHDMQHRPALAARAVNVQHTGPDIHIDEQDWLAAPLIAEADASLYPPNP